MEQIITAVIAAAIGLALGWLSGRFSYSNKIAEFRQAWINNLRADIADYISASEKWFGIWYDYSDADPERHILKELEDQLYKANYKAKTILNRIKLCINPEENEDKAEDDAFIEALEALMNNENVSRNEFNKKRQELQDDAVLKGRKILKREWQKTKKVIRPQWG